MSTDQLRVKLIVIGSASVGKSSLLVQYVDKQFISNLGTTIGVEYKQKIFQLTNGLTMRVQIWDTAGNQRYQTITPNYYRQIDGVLIVYDITSRDSFDQIHVWIKELDRATDISKISVLLVGNKTDLSNQREVRSDEGKKIADDLGICFVQTSAKTFETTRIAFDKLVEDIVSKKNFGKPQDKILIIHSEENDSGRSKKCC